MGGTTGKFSTGGMIFGDGINFGRAAVNQSSGAARAAGLVVIAAGERLITCYYVFT